MWRVGRSEILLLACWASVAAAEPNPKRKVTVLEYRAGSAALQGMAQRVVAAMSKQTSLAVHGPDQTRVLYGEQLDGTLVKCAGEADCIAKIGQKVGAQEVILVGVSELGDVILTMQRIDVRSKKVTARIADSLAENTTPTDAQVDAYLQKLLPPSDFLRFGMVEIVANLSGAAVTIGGEPKGVTPIPKLTLPAPATYDIRIEKHGYVSYRTRVELPPDGQLKVEAELSRRGESAWYQRWY
ncbi:MAG TPA: PEGA domain-containing protein, partial [Kofleriaceae bacterium]|nr:PEGA domain-containing protein [Kofleriaceae bacterium]